MTELARLGNNPWVTQHLENKEAFYLDDYKIADVLPVKLCNNGHSAYYFPLIKSYACPTCGIHDFSEKWGFTEENEITTMFNELLKTVKNHHAVKTVKNILSFTIVYNAKVN